jgi:HEAT repeat protein
VIYYYGFSQIMKKNSDTEIDNALDNFPDSLAKIVKVLFDVKNFRKKINARNTLVKMGKTIIPQMHLLVKSENGLIRMEAAKIVELVADRRSIPVLISLLNDKEFEIRWIAAEGLIKIGRRSLLPLLKAVRDGESSFFLNRGAHHILFSLLNDKEKRKLKPLIQSLDDYHELGETAPVEASKAINIIYKIKS